MDQFFTVLDATIASQTDLNALNYLLDCKVKSLENFPNSRKLSGFNLKPVLENSGFDSEILCEVARKVLDVCETPQQVLDAIVEYTFMNHKVPDMESKIVQLLGLVTCQELTLDTKEILFSRWDAPRLCSYFISNLSNPQIRVKVFEMLTLCFKLFADNDRVYCLNEVFAFCLEHGNLDVFCALVNIVSKELLYNDVKLCFREAAFWGHIEQFLSGSDSQLQRQAQYILSKYMTDFPQSGVQRFFIDGTSLARSWQAFFMLVDMAREKQIHLLAPCLDLFNYVDHLPLMWLKCVYKFYLNHSQNAVVFSVAIRVLERQYDNDQFKELISLVFKAVNKNEDLDILNRFFAKLTEYCEKLRSDQLEMALEEFVQIAWNPVSFYRVLSSLVSNASASHVRLDVIKDAIKAALRLPHVFIRTECLDTLIKWYCDKNNVLEVFHLVVSTEVPISCLSRHVSVDQCVSLFVKNLQKTITDVRQLKAHFQMFADLHIDIRAAIKDDYSNEMRPDITLFIWHNFLIHNQIDDDTDTELEVFLIDYHKNELRMDTADTFVDTVKALGSKHTLGEDFCNEVLHKVLQTIDYSDKSHLYVAVVLAGTLLANPASAYPHDYKISFKHKDAICFIFKDTVIHNVSINSAAMCVAALDLICAITQSEICLDTISDSVKLFKQICEFYDNNVICNIYKNLYGIVCKCIDDEDVMDFIDFCRANLWTIKKDQHYKSMVTHFIDAVYSEVYLKANRNNLDRINENLLELSESNPSIRHYWIKTIKERCEPMGSETFVMVVVELYLQGKITTKEERTEFNICKKGLQDQMAIEDESLNPIILGGASRLMCFQVLIESSWNDVISVINHLKDRYLRHFAKRYFPDSKVHYEKLRLVQALLMMSFQMRTGMNILHEFALKCLQEETNQNCVKQLLNWIIIMTGETANLEQGKGNSSSIINITPMIYHGASRESDLYIESIVTSKILPWTMGAQFKQRVYAQYLISRLLAPIENGNDTLRMIKSATDYCLSSVNMRATFKSDLPFIEHLNPFYDYTALNVLHEIPKLNQVYPAEYEVLFNTRDLEFFFYSGSGFHLAVTDYLLGATEQLPVTKETAPFFRPMDHLQTKITPWKSALECSNDAESKSDLILIASLIDKAQNLGGLCRTCEVFGINTLALDNAKVMTEKEFTSLSMSSETRISAIEAKKDELDRYILALQKEGYSVIGAEQTAGSKNINDFSFPRKTALLLGNEKTGIPPHLTPLLDVCLEIPQFGQTRSLNVHVAGAMFIWEYVKQHLVEK